MAKTLIARSFATATGLRFGRVQFTPDLLPSDVTGSSVFDQRAASFEFRPGPGVLQPAPGRRDQPRPAEDAGRAPGGDGGAPGHRRRRHPPARAALPRARHAEPDRVRGHLPAARGPARPLPRAPARRLPDGRRRVGHARRPRAPRHRRRRAARDHRRRRAAQPAGRGRGRPRRRRRRALHGRPRHGDARELGGRGRRQPARLAGAAAPVARAGRASRGATSSCPTTSRPSPCPALAHRLVLRPELWVRRVDAADVVQRVLDEVPAPPATEPQDDERQRVTDAR